LFPASFKGMGTPYANTISGLLKRRAELMADARELRKRMAVVGNDIARDQRLRADMVRRVSKSLKLLRKQGPTRSAYIPHEDFMRDLYGSWRAKPHLARE
jgi:hypothetical protein